MRRPRGGAAPPARLAAPPHAPPARHGSERLRAPLPARPHPPTRHAVPVFQAPPVADLSSTHASTALLNARLATARRPAAWLGAAAGLGSAAGLRTTHGYAGDVVDCGQRRRVWGLRSALGMRSPAAGLGEPAAGLGAPAPAAVTPWRVVGAAR